MEKGLFQKMLKEKLVAAELTNFFNFDDSDEGLYARSLISSLIIYNFKLVKFKFFLLIYLMNVVFVSFNCIVPWKNTL